MRTASVVIDPRFCGPPRSANGGYACGRIAAAIDGAAEVTLRKPPPLGKPMQIRPEEGGVALYDGDTLIGSAIATEVTIAAMQAPSYAAAQAAAARSFAAADHSLPTCFVCGPLREPGDGLRIHAGPLDAEDLDWSGLLAAPWKPAADLADETGTVLPEFVWAALDCPTDYACSSSRGLLSALLGRQAVQIMRCPVAGERCIVTAREVAHEGRKHFAEACLFGADGQALAICNALWIEVDLAVLRGDL